MVDSPSCWRNHGKILGLEWCAILFGLVFIATRAPFGLFHESPDLRPILAGALLVGALGSTAASTLVAALLAGRTGPVLAVFLSRLAAVLGAAIALVLATSFLG